MNKIYFIIVLSFIVGCTRKSDTVIIDSANNKELIKMVAQDQAARQSEENVPLEPIDEKHRKRVMQLLIDGEIKTASDKLNAALILQHTGMMLCNNELKSISAENYYLAHLLSKSAFESGRIEGASFVATTLDRYLLCTVGYQKYGTQKVIDDKTEEFVWAPIDSTTTDQDRKLYGISPLDTLLKQCKMKPYGNK